MKAASFSFLTPDAWPLTPMIITCANCTTRLQLEASKVPTRPFTVRCPKCQFIINAQPQAESVASSGGAFGVAGDLPASSRTQLRSALAAPAYRAEEAGENSAGTQPVGAQDGGETELARLLASLLQRGQAEAETSRGAKRRWERRRALVCAEVAHRDPIAGGLARAHYEVFVAENAAQAAERMREDRMDVLILDQDFDLAGGGAAELTREVGALRPGHRRRLFFVQLSKTARTGDQYAAFFGNFNFVVNAEDLDNLPRLLERAIREFNDLYRDFYKALNLSEL